MKIILTRQGFVVEGLTVTPDSADTPFALRLIAMISDHVDSEGLARPSILLGSAGMAPVIEKVNLP